MDDLFYYLQNKDRFSKTLRRKDYRDAIDQIEAEIRETGSDGSCVSDNVSDSHDLYKSYIKTYLNCCILI